MLPLTVKIEGQLETALWSQKTRCGQARWALTSVGTLGTAGAIPFSALAFPELLLGELGAEPGALLQAESGGGRDTCEPDSGQARTPLPRP